MRLISNSFWTLDLPPKWVTIAYDLVGAIQRQTSFYFQVSFQDVTNVVTLGLMIQILRLRRKSTFIDHIQEIIGWIGWKPYKVTYSSDYFQELYDLAVELIKRDRAYVDHQKFTCCIVVIVPPDSHGVRSIGFCVGPLIIKHTGTSATQRKLSADRAGNLGFGQRWKARDEGRSRAFCVGGSKRGVL
ncbi:unnamed protein product [Calypogeia fissa]